MVYDSDVDVLRAFMGSGITVIVHTTNALLPMLASDISVATAWINTNIAPFAATISHISVGNEVLGTNNQSQYSMFLNSAIHNVYNALVSVNLHESILVSTTHAAAVLDPSSFPPSLGHFSSDIVPNIMPILNFLSSTGAPFMVNVYPFIAYIASSQNIELPYALGSGNVQISDFNSGLIYTSLFDAQVDTFISAIEKLGFGNISLIVTETGWPSYGHPSATLANAQAYNAYILEHVASSRGTPKRPSTPIQTQIFALFNENQKTGAEYEQHFGIFFPDQTKVYDISLTPT